MPWIFIVGVERIDLRDEPRLRRRLGHLNDFGVDVAERLARLVLVAHVDLRGRIRADDDDGKRLAARRTSPERLPSSARPRGTPG